MNSPKNRYNNAPQNPFSVGPNVDPAAEEYLERDVCQPHDMRDDTDMCEPDEVC